MKFWIPWSMFWLAWSVGWGTRAAINGDAGGAGWQFAWGTVHLVVLCMYAVLILVETIKENR